MEGVLLFFLLNNINQGTCRNYGNSCHKVRMLMGSGFYTRYFVPVSGNSTLKSGCVGAMFIVPNQEVIREGQMICRLFRQTSFI
jgi:hypothetical protein